MPGEKRPTLFICDVNLAGKVALMSQLYKIKRAVKMEYKKREEKNNKHIANLWSEAVVHRWPESCNFVEKETLAQVSFSEFCEIFKKTFLYRKSQVAASVCLDLFNKIRYIKPCTLETCQTSMMVLINTH